MNKTSVKGEKNPKLHSLALGTENKQAPLLAPCASLLVPGVGVSPGGRVCLFRVDLCPVPLAPQGEGSEVWEAEQCPN